VSTEAAGLTRRQLLHGGLAAGLAVGAVGVLAEPAGATQPTTAPRLRDGLANPTGIHPFRVKVPNKQLAALRRRVAATRWPTMELVADRSQGVQLATAQALARFWRTRYD
jgi:Epoxide hydrolase N terminus